MLTGCRQNYHHSKLPEPGEIGYIIIGYARFSSPRYLGGRRRKCIVESFPLTDSPDYRYSIGIHTITVRFLDNRERARYSGAYFHPLVC